MRRRVSHKKQKEKQILIFIISYLLLDQQLLYPLTTVSSTEFVVLEVLDYCARFHRFAV